VDDIEQDDATMLVDERIWEVDAEECQLEDDGQVISELFARFVGKLRKNRQDEVSPRETPWSSESGDEF
jgi:hypothetical protein